MDMALVRFLIYATGAVLFTAGLGVQFGLGAGLAALGAVAMVAVLRG